MTNGHFSTVGAYSQCPIVQGHLEHLDRSRRASERARVTAAVAGLLAGVGFHNLQDMTDRVCELFVEARGSAMSSRQHELVIEAVREMWELAHPVQVYEITPAGRAALEEAECVDCFAPAEPDSMMCTRCKARHRTPDRSDVRQAVA